MLDFCFCFFLQSASGIIGTVRYCERVQKQRQIPIMEFVLLGGLQKKKILSVQYCVLFILIISTSFSPNWLAILVSRNNWEGFHEEIGTWDLNMKQKENVLSWTNTERGLGDATHI